MAAPIKILMTADTIGGVWTYAMQLCKALQAFNIEVHLCTMGRFPDGQQLRQVSAVKNTTLYAGNFKLEWMEGCETDVLEARRWLKDIYKQVKPDILHFNNYGQTDAAWDCPVITVYHSCVQTWWRAVYGAPPPEAWGWYTGIVQAAIDKSDIVIAPSRAMLHQAEVAFGDFNTAEIINNGIDFQQQEVDKEPFILTAGRVWDEAKNIRLLCDITGELPWPVYVAGDNKGAEHNFPNIHFTGQLPENDMQRMMDKASVFVMPSKYEPFGLAVLEAARAGCALVLADIPTFRELWGDAAAYFNPFDAQSAKTAIKSIVDNELVRNDFAGKAKEKAESFSAALMAGKYYELYTKLYARNTNYLNKTA